MAFTYGTVTNCKVRNGQTRKEYECRLGYEVQSQSIANNTSSVKLKLECRSISSSYNTKGSRGLTSKIDGTTVKNNAAVDMSDTKTWQNFGERTITVTHNSNGTYSASKNGSFTCTAGSSNYSLSSGSASVTVSPATIPRYFSSTPTISVKSKTTTSVTINWTTPENCSTVQYKIGDGYWVDIVADANAKSGSYTITGLSPNTNYIIYGDFKRRDSGLWAQTKPSVNVTTYAKTIPTVSVSSKTETSITVSSSSNVTVSSTKYRIMKSGGSYGSWQTSDTFSGLSANTTYTVQVEKVGQASGETGYATIDVTTYDYPYCTSRPDFKIGSKLNLQFYNPLNRTMQIQMWSHKSQSFVSDLISVTGTSYSGFDNIIDRLYASIPNDTESKYNIYVHYAGNKAINEGGKYSTNGTENPVFSNFSYEDTNDKTKALTGNNQILVNGYSNLKVTISTANKAYSNYASPINKYRLNVGNMSSVEKAYSSTAAVELSINSVNSPSITVTAIDGRNYTAQVPKTATFKGYFKPIIKSMAVTRSNSGVGSQVTLYFDGEWWNDNFGKVANSISNISYYYKKTTDTTWTKGNVAIIPTINENNFSGNILIEGPNADDKGFDVSTSYNIKISATDALATSTEYQAILGSGTPGIALCNNKVAIGQKYDEELGGTLQIDGYDVSNKFKQYLPLIGGNLKGDINFGHNLGVSWKEEGYEDKFKIVSNFSGSNDDNKLKIMGAVGEEGTNPDLYDLMTISGKSGNMWVKGDLTAIGNISSSEGILQAKPVVAYSNVSGTTGTIILSVDASNYKNMRVSYFFDTNEYASNDFSSIEKVNGYYCLSSAKSAGNMEYSYIHTCLINVNAKTITLSRNRTLGLSISDNDIYTPGGDNNLYITKVELWN